MRYLNHLFLFLSSAPCVRDRIAQAAFKLVFEPVFEVTFADWSHGFRSGCSCKDALQEVDQLLKAGYRYVVGAGQLAAFGLRMNGLAQNDGVCFQGKRDACYLGDVADRFAKRDILQLDVDRGWNSIRLLPNNVHAFLRGVEFLWRARERNLMTSASSASLRGKAGDDDGVQLLYHSSALAVQCVELLLQSCGVRNGP